MLHAYSRVTQVAVSGFAAGTQVHGSAAEATAGTSFLNLARHSYH